MCPWMFGSQAMLKPPFLSRVALFSWDCYSGARGIPLFFRTKPCHGFFSSKIWCGILQVGELEDEFPTWNGNFTTGWWFGTFFIFPYIGNLIIPIDFHIFQRGGPTTNQIWWVTAGAFRDGISWCGNTCRPTLRIPETVAGRVRRRRVFHAGPFLMWFQVTTFQVKPI